MRFLQILTFSLVLLLAACGDETIETNMSEEIADFEFTTQNNKQLGLKDLAGEWWIADFMYTHCTQVCPTMTANMVRVQEELQELGLDAQIVSFSVDPDHDSPEVLKEHAEEYQADLSNWSFLTGYEFETIQDFSEHSFKTSVQEGSPGDVQFAHGTSFFLVNPDGELVKKYDGMGSEEMELIIEDLKKVL